MYSDNESLYPRTSVSKIKKGDFCHLPVMFDIGKNKVLFTEAALHNYPGMFLEKGLGNTMLSKFPKNVLETAGNDALYDTITKKADYIAKVSGKRAYPWRLFIITDNDRTFVESNLVTQLFR